VVLVARSASGVGWDGWPHVGSGAAAWEGHPGGQNMIEPAAYGRRAVGPHGETSATGASVLEGGGGGRAPGGDASETGSSVRRLLADAGRAAALGEAGPRMGAPAKGRRRGRWTPPPPCWTG